MAWLTTLPLRLRRLLPLAALALVPLLGACGDVITGPGGATDTRLTGSWRRVEPITDEWWGNALLESTWTLRRDGTATYTEVVADLAGRALESSVARADWYADRQYGEIVVDFRDPAEWGRERLRYDITFDGRDDVLVLDGLQFVRVGY